MSKQIKIKMDWRILKNENTKIKWDFWWYVQAFFIHSTVKYTFVLIPHFPLNSIQKFQLIQNDQYSSICCFGHTKFHPGYNAVT